MPDFLNSLRQIHINIFLRCHSPHFLLNIISFGYLVVRCKPTFLNREWHRGLSYIFFGCATKSPKEWKIVQLYFCILARFLSLGVLQNLFTSKSKTNTAILGYVRQAITSDEGILIFLNLFAYYSLTS